MAVKKTFLDVVIDVNEELGVLDTGFIEDYHGVDGYLSLFHVDTGQEFSIVMANVEGGGPYPTDHLEGTRDATVMPVGLYEIRGRVRDIVGNYTILSSFQNPIGTEGVQAVVFSLDSPAGLALVVEVSDTITISVTVEDFITTEVTEAEAII